MTGNTMAPRFTIGRTLGDSLKIFGRNIVAFALVALAIRLLFLLAPDRQTAAVMTGAAEMNWFNAIVSMVIAVVVISSTKAIVVFPTMQNLRGHRAAVSDLWRSVPFLPAIIVAGAIINLPSLASLVVQSLFPGNAVALVASGIVVSIVALVLLLMWWLYVPTIAVEKGGTLHGLRRSRYLLGGQRWRVFGLLVIVSVASSAIIGGIAFLAGFRLTDLSSLPSIRSMSPIAIAIFVMSALISAFDGVLVTVSVLSPAHREGGRDRRGSHPGVRLRSRTRGPLQQHCSPSNFRAFAGDDCPSE